MKLMLRRVVPHLAAAVLSTAGAAHAEIDALINPGDQGERSRFAVYSAWKEVLDQALQRDKLAAAQTKMSTDSTADLAATRSRLNDIVIGPAHVVGSAARYGYQPVAALNEPVQAVLVTAAGSPINNLAEARGKKLGLPMQDSLVTYLIRGEVNAANLTTKQHFAMVYESRYQDALLVCLQLRQCDLVGVERVVYDRWAASGQAVKIVLESKAVPGLAVATKPGVVGPSLDSLRVAAAQKGLDGKQSLVGSLVPARKEDFVYVSTLGYFTPRSLPGATVIDVAAAQQLMQGGVPYIDTRNDVEFREGHVPGARLVPYQEKSRKEPDFDPKEDQFDVTKLPPDKHAPVIFGCNGPECWKSFKASSAAIAAGYAKVYWFRGGFPEWRDSGKKVITGSDPL